MFDDPQKDLRRLQEQLLAAEEEPEPVLPEPAEIPEQEETDEEAPPEGTRKLGWLLVIMLLELGAAMFLLAWWLQWR